MLRFQCGETPAEEAATPPTLPVAGFSLIALCAQLGTDRQLLLTTLDLTALQKAVKSADNVEATVSHALQA